MNKKITDITGTFRPISLQHMDEVALFNRADTKFILPLTKIPEILKAVINDYNILEVNSDRIMTYKSLYFDTPDYAFYKWHHNGKLNRLKVRIRNYVESNIYFLEVKSKNGKGITKKNRIACHGFETNLSTESKQFINKTTKDKFTLEAIIENRFNRITLVSLAKKERVTVDFNLHYKNNSREKTFENLAIIEIKQKDVDRGSPVYKALKKRAILPYGISKYCLGMVNIYDNIKYNAFKKVKLKIQKLTT
ncbi:MAG: hypothetical protein ACI9DJ_001606 [Algoriphagus sp.]|jgi:hypothetical protein